MNLKGDFSFHTALMGALSGVVALSLLSACQQQQGSSTDPVNTGKLVTAEDQTANKLVGDSTAPYRVLGQAAVEAGFADGSLVKTSDAKAQKALNALAEGQTVSEEVTSETTEATAAAPSLTVGFPISLMKEFQVFGGVITKVTDTKSEDLGGLKLTDLTPLHVRPSLAKDPAGNFFFVLNGCVNKCTELSGQEQLIGVPVSGIDTTNGVVLLDLAAMGGELNLIQMLDPDGDYTKLKTKASVVSAVDYSLNTLVFDIEVKMVPVGTADADIATAPETTFTIRWYLKLTSVFNPAFEARTATEGVGYFMTERTAVPKIQRWSQFALGTGSTSQPQVHYYVKHVPAEFQASFGAAFDEWNTNFEAATGKKLLTYEFIDATDPRSALLVPGDIRFNILEWDLVNNAPYGGLGPSIANQHTGEMLSANVLVQGPRIVEIYTKWFGVSTEAEALRANGHDAEADLLEAEGLREIEAIANRHEAVRARKISLALGKKLSFRVASQLPSLSDPVAEKESFDPVPAGFTYEAYMAGYFRELVAHELGHNMGLRHNFRGNHAYTGMTEGGVSNSIMEYLNRGFRHLNRISAYDAMAIKYGYMGTAPAVKTLFCTDEDVITEAKLTNSPECSRDDATNDAFGYFEKRLTRSIDLLLARGKDIAPEHTLADVTGELEKAVKGMAFYAASASATAAKWTNFFAVAGRPATAADVRPYVLKQLKAQVCDGGFATVLAQKVDDAARTKTLANITALRSSTTKLATALKFTSAELACGTP